MIFDNNKLFYVDYKNVEQYIFGFMLYVLICNLFMLNDIKFIILEFQSSLNLKSYLLQIIWGINGVV